MQDDVNTARPLPSLREAQIAHTEQRIVAAATELFLADGYVATTLEAVAKRAQVGARTVYVRFGTKAALFKRVVDVAIVGDTQPIAVLDRDWAKPAGAARAAADSGRQAHTLFAVVALGRADDHAVTMRAQVWATRRAAQPFFNLANSQHLSVSYP